MIREGMPKSPISRSLHVQRTKTKDDPVGVRAARAVRAPPLHPQCHQHLQPLLRLGWMVSLCTQTRLDMETVQLQIWNRYWTNSECIMSFCVCFFKISSNWKQSMHKILGFHLPHPAVIWGFALRQLLSMSLTKPWCCLGFLATYPWPLETSRKGEYEIYLYLNLYHICTFLPISMYLSAPTSIYLAIFLCLCAYIELYICTSV